MILYGTLYACERCLERGILHVYVERDLLKYLDNPLCQIWSAHSGPNSGLNNTKRLKEYMTFTFYIYLIFT